ncbi:MAG: DNA-protecting protein DprA [Bacteroidia bacterium]|nr:DNA-protecting protein DprA [Bacteroidia bacterium]
MNQKEKSGRLLFDVALSLLPEIGPVKAKALLAYCGSAENVFKASRRELEKIPGIGKGTVASVHTAEIVEAAEQEIRQCQRNGINVISYTSAEYPSRLKQCGDGPIVLFCKGNATLNYSRIVSVVGSRDASVHGKEVCEQIVRGLKEMNAMVVSGLAYGMDICAHRACLKLDIPTIGVLAHGLDTIYPSAHRTVAERMCENGGLITEFPFATRLHPDHFPRRNRIIAGMADALIVVEAGMRSGSLVTATLANDYSRDVFAVPGRWSDSSSEGTNHLIKTNKAALIQSVSDIEYLLGWEKKEGERQMQLFRELDEEEKRIVDALKKSDDVHIDDLSILTDIPGGKLLSKLLSMEFDGIVVSQPGKKFHLCK